MKVLKKYRIAIVIAIVVVLVGVVMFMGKNDVRTPMEEVVITPTAFQKVVQADKVDTASWETFNDEKLKFTMKHPADVIIDARQTSEGRLTAFIFEEDQDKELSENVPVLYIADTHKKGIDGFSAFRKGDCGKECKVSYKGVSWVNINNLYGVKNPMPGNVANYFLTDKKQTHSVINFYVGGYTKKDVKEKIVIFEQMIKTVEFEK